MDKIFTTILTDTITAKAFFLCTLTSVLLGFALAFAYMFKNSFSKSFVITIASLPIIVQLVMMLVNGNIGTGIAVMGAFSLIRFRSAPGTAREILAIFAAMAIGLACGVGFIGIAAVFTVIFIIINFICTITRFGEHSQSRKTLRITIPENLDYTEVFDDTLNRFSSKHELIKVKTTNMGSLYQLTYEITLKNVNQEKEFIDELRIKNGNLEIICSRLSASGDDIL